MNVASLNCPISVPVSIAPRGENIGNIDTVYFYIESVYTDSTPVNPKAGEVYFTDSMVLLAKKLGLLALDFEGTRYDMGNKLGIMKANCEFALAHDEIGEDFRNYIKELAKTL